MRPINPDSVKPTSTVAELKALGFQGIESRCPSCGQIVVQWWNLLRVPTTTTLEEIGGRAKCSRCGEALGLIILIFKPPTRRIIQIFRLQAL